jgi:hypothetical protein
MEQYFEEIAAQMEGYEDFRKDAWFFKVSCHQIFFKRFSSSYQIIFFINDSKIATKWKTD